MPCPLSSCVSESSRKPTDMEEISAWCGAWGEKPSPGKLIQVIARAGREGRLSFEGDFQNQEWPRFSISKITVEIKSTYMFVYLVSKNNR